MERLSQELLIGNLPDRFQIKDVLPGKLSSLYKHFIVDPNRYTDLKVTVMNKLLDLTIKQAYTQSLFYKKLYEPLKAYVKNENFNLKNLCILPTISREDLQNAGDSICSAYADFAFTSYTSGTTSRKPLLIDRCAQEQSYIYNFFSLLKEDATEQEAALVLSLTGLYHGRVIEIPGNAYTFPVTITNETRLYHAKRLMERSFLIDGKEKHISVITGPTSSVISFTAFLQSENLSNFKNHVALIQTSGHYFTKYSQKWISNFWNSQVIDAFSLTEVFCGASKCQECSYYHFDPFGIAEVLDIDNGKPLEKKGRGRLAITGLYPFTQMTPIIRYVTGDLVEVKEVKCTHDNIGYCFLGREVNSLLLKDENNKSIFLSGGEVYEVLDDIPDIAHPPRDFNLPASCFTAGVPPIFWFDIKNDTELFLNIELQYSPCAFPERINELSKLINDRLVNTCTFMRYFIEKRILNIIFHPPQSIPSEKLKFRP